VIRAQGALGPERRGQHIERLGHRGMLLLGDPVVDPGAVAAAVDDAGGAQDAEMARSGRLVEVERGFQVADAQLAVREQRDDAQPGLVADRGWLRTFIANPRRLVESLVDFALITASFALAYYLRLQGSGVSYQRHIFAVSIAVVVAARYLAFIPFGLYRGVWRYAGARDAASIVAAVVVSEVVAYLILDATQTWGPFPRSVFIIDALICTVLIGASRFWERAFVRGVSSFTGRAERHRTLIVGAGRGGRSLLRELRETPGEQVVGFVDDDPRLSRRRLQGVPVLGDTSEIEQILSKARPDTVLVTIPDAPRERLGLVVDACALAQLPCRFVRRHTDLDPDIALRATVD